MDKAFENNEQIISEKRRGVLKWIKEHKKQLLAGGICLATLCLVIFTIKSVDDLNKLLENMKKAVKGNHIGITSAPIKDSISENVTTSIKITRSAPKEMFTVHGFPRKLPYGQHASLEKKREAALNGIILLPNQTYVADYTKGLTKAS